MNPALSRLKTTLQLLALVFGYASLVYAQQNVNIHAIQTNLPNSPYLGQVITTEGIVVAVVGDGFYIENSPFHLTCTDPSVLNCWDALDSTSEGILVYTKTAPDPSYASIGNLVYVTGTVAASNTSADNATHGTEIQVTATPTRADDVNYTVPIPISPLVLNAYTTGDFGQWLPFEGMRINVPVLITTSGTGGTVTLASQTATSNGQFWGVLPAASGTTARPFRATGINILQPVPSSAPATVSRWSANPSLIFIDGSNLGGSQPPLDVTANSTVTNLTGVVDYHASALGYTALILDNDPPYYYGYQPGAVTPGPGANGTPANTPTANQTTIATQNLDNFYDTSVVDATAFSNRISKAALAIVHFLNSPDILAVQQVQSMDALTALASQIENDGGPNYTPCWFAGNDPSGLTNGFLVNESHVTVQTCAQVDAGTMFSAPSGNTSKLFDRPPLVLTASIPRGTLANYPITVVNSEFLDATNIDDPQLGADVRAQRGAQAQELSSIVQGYQSAGGHVVALGEYHSFEFSDGFVDTVGVVDGSPVAANLVTLAVSTVTQPPLVNLTTEEPANDRYTFVKNGSAEDTDHILITADMASMASTSYAHFAADFPVDDLNDPATALRASSHDGVVSYLAIPQGAQFVLTSSLNPSGFGQNVTFTATASGGTGIPTGTITFYDGGKALCNAQTASGGTATCSSSTLSIGQHAIEAAYSGDSVYASTTASLTQTVKPQAPQFTLTSSANPSFYQQSVTFTATAAGTIGTPTGTVIFNDGNATLCAVQPLSNGAASCTTSTLSIGVHPISATYSGDTEYAPETATLSQTVDPDPTFSMTISPGNVSLYTGQAASYLVSIIPGNNFLLNVALACTNLPPATTCTFSPSTVVGGHGVAKFVVQTSPPVNTSAKADSAISRKGLPVLACLFLLLAPRRLRRRGKWLVAAMFLPILAGTISACGGSGTLTGGTPAATYTITVNGNAIGSPVPVAATATTTLKVNSLF